MLNLKIDKNLKIIYSVWIFLVLGSLVLLYSLPFVMGAEGDPKGSWSVGSETTSPYGITTYGNFIWVLDNYPSGVYKYNIDGGYIGTPWNPEIGTPSAMTTDGTNIWITHPLSDRVSKYHMDGTPDGTWNTASGNDDPWGITTNGTFIWIVDYYDKRVYKYKMDGTPDGTWNTASGNTFPKGITTDGDSFWIVDSADKRVYKYELIPPSTCTCPGLNYDWEINMAEHCVITSDCNLGTGTLSFTGSGYVRCDATIDTANLGDPGPNGVLYFLDNCLIRVKRACDVDKDGYPAEGVCGGNDCDDNNYRVHPYSLWTASTSLVDVNCDGSITIVKWVFQSYPKTWDYNSYTENVTDTPCEGRTSGCEDSYYVESLPTACGSSVAVEGCSEVNGDCEYGDNEGTYYIRCR